MKILVLIFCLVFVGCTQAQESPVGIAYSLYKMCAMSDIETNGLEFGSKKELETYIHDMDYNCMNWAAIWLPVGMKNPRELTDAEIARFDKMRGELLMTIMNDSVVIRKIQK